MCTTTAVPSMHTCIHACLHEQHTRGGACSCRIQRCDSPHRALHDGVPKRRLRAACCMLHATLGHGLPLQTLYAYPRPKPYLTLNPEPHADPCVQIPLVAVGSETGVLRLVALTGADHHKPFQVQCANARAVMPPPPLAYAGAARSVWRHACSTSQRNASHVICSGRVYLQVWAWV